MMPAHIQQAFANQFDTQQALIAHRWVCGLPSGCDESLQRAADRDMLERGGLFAWRDTAYTYGEWFKKVCRKPDGHLTRATGDPCWWIDGLERMSELREREQSDLEDGLQALGFPVDGAPKVRSAKIIPFPSK